MRWLRTGAPFEGTQRFEVMATLGSGAAGTVYEVLDHVRKTRVALKTLTDLDPELRYRFKREFRALSNVHDEHLVELYELVADNDPWFFTMELIVGTDFMSYLRGSMSRRPAPASNMRERSAPPTRNGRRNSWSGASERMSSIPCAAPTDFTRVRAAFAQLCRGVEALHRRGLLHRDVKPSNVLVTSHGRVVLVDFGIVAELNSNKSTQDLTAAVGTPAYMAPEQGAGETVSEATDFYGVGTMLFEALTGRLPFEGSNGFGLIQAKIENEAPRARDLLPQVPEDLDELCARLLAQDPAQRPAFREIIRTLDAHGRYAALPVLETASDSPFVGRERELQQLSAVLGEVKPGQPVLLHVPGGSGMGKSTLLAHFLDGLKIEERALVLSGRCCERESVPFKALDDVIDALAFSLATLREGELPALSAEGAAALLRIFPVMAHVPELVAAAQSQAGALDYGSLLLLRGHAVAALRTLLGHLGAERPVVLAIDDAQWGDEDSAYLLRELLAPPTPPGILLVLSYRREYEGRTPLLEARGGGSGLDVTLRTVPIDALPEGRARTLAAHWLGRTEGDPAVTTIVGEAMGSPLLLGEFARHVRAVGVPAEGLNLAAVLRARFAELDEAARKLLEALSVAARPVDPFLAARAAQLAPEDGASALRALRRVHLVRDSDAREGATRIETFHDRVREALVSALDEQSLRAQHRLFVSALTEVESRDVEALYQHSLGAGDHARAADYAALAAQDAARSLAFIRAAELFQAAQKHAPEGDERCHGWGVERAEALACAGRRKDAAEAYLSAAASAAAEEKLRLEVQAVQQYLTGGHFDLGMQLAEVTARGVGTPLASSRNKALGLMVARLGWLTLRGTRFTERTEAQLPKPQLEQIDLAYRVGRGVAITDPIRGSELFTRTVLLTLKAGEIKRVAIALSCLSTLLAVEGPNATVRRLVEQSTELALRSGDIQTLAVASLGHGCMHALNGFWRPALVELERTDALFQQLKSLPTAEQHDTRSLLLVVRYYLGQMKELCQRVPAAIAEATQLEDAYSRSLLTTSKAGLCWLAMDQPELHAELAVTGVTTQARGNALCIEHVLQMVTLMDNDLYVGKPERAAERLRQTYPAAKASLLLRMVIASTLVSDVTGRMAMMRALNGGDVRENRRIVLAQARALEGKKHLPFPQAIAIMLRAGEADIDKRAGDALTLYRRAAEAFDASGMALHAAVARWRLGQWLGGDEGRALCLAAEQFMREQSILVPERMATMMAPTSRS